MRLRIDTPWDWREHHELRSLEVAAQPGGQPRVGWRARYRTKATGEERTVEGHVELRWSHGRFSGPRHEEVPGFHPLEPGGLEPRGLVPVPPVGPDAEVGPGADSGPPQLFEV